MLTPMHVNEAWSLRLLTHLYRAGVRHICIAPGSRSASLAIAAQKMVSAHADMQWHSHFDERGLGFFALGLIKASHAPVAVITTSGTAVANLLPAVVEAFQSRLPLIMVTADRPDELLNCGANQAIDQQGIFGVYAPLCLNLATPNSDSQPDELDIAWQPAQQQLQGSFSTPIHINCPFREPLYSPESVTTDQISVLRQRWLTHWPAVDAPPPSSALPTLHDAESSQKTLVVMGAVSDADALIIVTWAATLGLPILADFGSGIRMDTHDMMVAYPDLLLATASGKAWLAQFENIVQFGGRIIGRRLGQWLGKTQQPYVIVSNTHHSLDPHHRATHHFQDVAGYCASHQHTSNHTVLPQHLVSAIESHINAETDAGFSELTMVQALTQKLPLDVALFAGNSLSIRWLDSLSVRQTGHRQTFSQRGASGIDGLIATATGVAKAYPFGTTLLIGDTSALHDLNSLALAVKSTRPLVIIINNNQGGSIFNLLPVVHSPNTNRDLFRCEHPWHFDQVAAMFGLPYWQSESRDTFTAALQTALEYQGASIVECCFDSEDATDRFTHLIASLTDL